MENIRNKVKRKKSPGAAAVALMLLSAAALYGAGQPLSIAEQGSFAVGGKEWKRGTGLLIRHALPAGAGLPKRGRLSMGIMGWWIIRCRQGQRAQRCSMSTGSDSPDAAGALLQTDAMDLQR